MSQSISRAVLRRGLALLGISGIIAASVGVLPAKAAVDFAQAAFSGSAVGSAIHVDALTADPETRVANADVAYATAAVNSKGLATQALNENSRVISPARPSKNAYGEGLALEVGLVGPSSAPGQLQLAGVAENDAPPTTPDVVQDLGPITELAPLAYASAVHAASHAKWNTDTCVLGSDISSGLAYAADAQLVDAGAGEDDGSLESPIVATDATPPARNVVQTFSQETLVPNSAGAFGLRSRVSQTLAPVTLADSVTIEVLGEWVLTATATGIAGQSKVEYAPGGNPTPTTPILRIIQDAVPTNVLTFQDIFGAAGLDQIVIPGVAEIAIGEDPRAIGGDATTAPTVSADGTTVSAAVDVVRVKLLEGQGGDVRIGHMETKATVPSGGITCPIPVTKSADPSTVTSSTPGGNFVVTITIKNSFDCDLTGVTAEDVISRKSGNATFSIVTNDARNDPKAGAGATFTNTSPTSAKAVYAGLGTIPPGGTKVLKVVIHVIGGSGEIQDIATAKGTLSCPGGNAIGQAVALTGSFTLVTKVAGAAVLARTGGSDIGLLAAVPVLALLAGRRLRRSKRSTS
ncbi:MAG: hypothetical protein QOF21_1743 [Actinomycetota bacterium]|jgi:hypothetical protein